MLFVVVVVVVVQLFNVVLVFSVFFLGKQRTLLTLPTCHGGCACFSREKPTMPGHQKTGQVQHAQTVRPIDRQQELPSCRLFVVVRTMSMCHSESLSLQIYIFLALLSVSSSFTNSIQLCISPQAFMYLFSS